MKVTTLPNGLSAVMYLMHRERQPIGARKAREGVGALAARQRSIPKGGGGTGKIDLFDAASDTFGKLAAPLERRIH